MILSQKALVSSNARRFLPFLGTAVRLSLVAATGVFAAMALPAFAISFSAGGLASYESIRPEGFNDENLGGVGVSALFQADVTKLSGQTGLLLGAEVQFMSLEGEANNTKVEWTQATFGPFLGISVPVNARFSLQTTLGYDFGVSGEFSEKIGEGTEISKDTESFGRVRHDWRGVFGVTNAIGVGFGVGWHAGATDLADTAGSRDFRGWGMKGVFLYDF
jgi:hypothetical protein